MPNWCENQIKITGSPEKMKVLIDKFKELETNKEPIMEYLLGKDDRPANYDEGGWYDYNCNKFGTKWDFLYDDDISVSVMDTQIDIDVMTAWAPPSNFLQLLCVIYGVNARIHYDEPGMGFSGTEVFSPETFKFGEGFWDDAQHYAEKDIMDNMSYDDFMKRFHYVPEEFHPKLKEIYDDAVDKIKNLP
jgi:hypothetical protein